MEPSQIPGYDSSLGGENQVLRDSYSVGGESQIPGDGSSEDTIS